MPQRRKTEIVQVNLRMREDFRQRLWREAEKSGRSFNQELVHRLEESFTHEETAAMRDAILSAHDERNKQLQDAFANLQSLSKDIDARREELAKRERAIQDLQARLTETLEAGIKK